MLLEKRKHFRFAPGHNKAFIALGNEFTRVGQIRDICVGGVAFDYFFHKDLEYNPSQQLDIFMPGNKFYLRNLPCNIVYDILHLKRTANPLFLAKRIGLQFRELTHSQTTHLMFFLENHTVQ